MCWDGWACRRRGKWALRRLLKDPAKKIFCHNVAPPLQEEDGYLIQETANFRNKEEGNIHPGA